MEPSTVGRARPWLFVAAAAIGWCVVCIVVLHVVSSHDPVLDTLSCYAFTDRGQGLLAIGILALAVGTLAILGALLAARVPVSHPAKALFGTLSGGLTLAAVFPASYAEFPNPVSGEIHQYSCLAAFLSAPAIGMSMVRRVAAVPALAACRARVARWTRLSAAGFLVFGISYVLRDLHAVGVAQRLMLAVDLVLLGSLLVLAGRAAVVNRPVLSR
jgi:Protein of unknown function (DUF998)